MPERFGRRWVFGGLAAAYGIVALAIIVFGMRRRATNEDAGGESHGTVGERFGEDREEEQEAAVLPKEELVRRAQQISRGPARESQESEPTEATSETEQEEVSGESARGESQESEPTDMASESQESERADVADAASETEQEARRYLKDVQFPASKDDLVSAARSNDAPQRLIKKLVDLPITEYSELEDVVVAVDSGP